jgi:hypothetical protein
MMFVACVTATTCVLAAMVFQTQDTRWTSVVCVEAMTTLARAVMVLRTVQKSTIAVVHAWQSTHSLVLEQQAQMAIGTNVLTATLCQMEAQRWTSALYAAETMLALDVMVSRIVESAWMHAVFAAALMLVSAATISQIVDLLWISVATVVVPMSVSTVRVFHTEVHYTIFVVSVMVTAQAASTVRV